MKMKKSGFLVPRVARYAELGMEREIERCCAIAIRGCSFSLQEEEDEEERARRGHFCMRVACVWCDGGTNERHPCVSWLLLSAVETHAVDTAPSIEQQPRSTVSSSSSSYYTTVSQLVPFYPSICDPPPCHSFDKGKSHVKQSINFLHFHCPH